MNRLTLGLACTAVAALIVGYAVGRARAGVPATTPLFYSGYLEDANGAVTDSGKTITVTLFDAQSAGNAVCTVSPAGVPPPKTPVAAGRFRVALAADCVAAVQAKSDVWIEVGVEGQTLPRTKIGAVPYAVSAANAASVEWSGVTGAGPSTEWPGTVPYTRVTGAPPPPANVYTNPTTGKTYSLAGSYCGKTVVVDGALRSASGAALGSGLPGTKSLCESTCGNPAAHMCNTAEVVRYLATGGTFADSESWYSVGTWGWDAAGRNGTSSPIPGEADTDCNSWTSNLISVEGAVSYPADSAHSTYCNELHPILCCV